MHTEVFKKIVRAFLLIAALVLAVVFMAAALLSMVGEMRNTGPTDPYLVQTLECRHCGLIG